MDCQTCDRLPEEHGPHSLLLKPQLRHTDAPAQSFIKTTQDTAKSGLVAVALACCALSAMFLPEASHADNLTTTNVNTGGNSTNIYNGVPLIGLNNWTNSVWQTNGTGVAVPNPVAGNTYEA